MTSAISTRLPGPRGKITGDSLLFFKREPDAFLRLARKYGDVVYFKVGPQEIFLFSHPDHVRDVLITKASSFVKGWAPHGSKGPLGQGLITLEGEAHRLERRLLQPAFHRERLMEASAITGRFVQDSVRHWKDREVVDLYPQMVELTASVITAALFGDRFVSGTRVLIPALDGFLERFNPWMLPYAALLQKLLLPGNYRIRHHRRMVDQYVEEVISYYRQHSSCGGLMPLLMPPGQDSGEVLSERRVRDEIVTFLIAGHATVAITLAWCFWLLASFPEWQSELHREVDEVGGKGFSFDDLRRLSTCEKIIAETMRLYPAQWMTGRKAVNDCEVDGVSIPAGSLVLVSQYVIHRDARWYPAPDRFDPERFSPANVASRPQNAYFPFGAGTRRCIGEQFAWMEATLILATLAREWHVSAERPFHPGFHPRVLLRPQSPVPLVFQRRKAG